MSSVNTSSNMLSPKQSLIRSNYKHNDDSERLKNENKPSEKRQINFLKGLNQNQTLKETAAIEEYYQDGKIIVNMHSRDLMTFVRLQHEVNELKRKQDDFNVQKERHFNLSTQDVEQNLEKKQDKFEQTKTNDAWWMGTSSTKKPSQAQQQQLQQQVVDNFQQKK